MNNGRRKHRTPQTSTRRRALANIVATRRRAEHDASIRRAARLAAELDDPRRACEGPCCDPSYLDEETEQ
jgi:hypothetical protein